MWHHIDVIGWSWPQHHDAMVMWLYVMSCGQQWRKKGGCDVTSASELSFFLCVHPHAQNLLCRARNMIGVTPRQSLMRNSVVVIMVGSYTHVQDWTADALHRISREIKALRHNCPIRYWPVLRAVWPWTSSVVSVAESPTVATNRGPSPHVQNMYTTTVSIF